MVVDGSAQREREKRRDEVSRSFSSAWEGWFASKLCHVRDAVGSVGLWRGRLAHVGSGRVQKITRIQMSLRRDCEAAEGAKDDMTTVYSFTIALACAPPSEFQGLAVGKIYRGLYSTGSSKCRCQLTGQTGRVPYLSSGRETNKVLTIHNPSDTSTGDRITAP